MPQQRPRIAIAGFQHETNTFVPKTTTFADFQEGGGWPALSEGNAVIQTHHGLNIPLGGFIAAAGPAADLHPILWANAEPSGLVQDPAFDRIAHMILDGIVVAGPLDGIYLDLHGAMVTESHQDGEGALLHLIRDAVGPNVPIAVSLDLHANLSADLVALADIITIYRTYPHLDMAETGARAWSILRQMIRSQRRPAKALRPVDHLIPLSAQCTDFGPVQALYARLLDTPAGVWSADIALGFPLADVHDVGPAVVSYAEDQTKADALADDLAAALRNTALSVENPLMSPRAAVRRAMEQTASGGIVVLADVQDNSGAGAMSNSPGLLLTLLDEGAEKAVLGTFWAPEIAALAHRQCVGAEISIPLKDDHGRARNIPARVAALSGGTFTCTGAMQRDVVTDIGPSALLHLNGAQVAVVISTLRHQSIDQQSFRHLGVDLEAYRIIAVKSTVHYRADFAPLAQEIIAVEAPGLSICRLDTLNYQRARSAVRP